MNGPYRLLEVVLLDLLEALLENEPHKVHELVDSEEIEFVPVLAEDNETELVPLKE